jgi:hypothetical protein
MSNFYEKIVQKANGHVQKKVGIFGREFLWNFLKELRFLERQILKLKDCP